MHVQNLLDRLMDAGRRAGFSSRIFARIKDYELPVFTRSPANGIAPSAEVYVSAGVHGDEPGAPLAVLEALRKQEFSDDIAWTIVPIVNPTGLAAKTRENAAGIDLNRDYGSAPKSEETRAHLAWLGDRRYDVAICLHEDYETDGAYLYELGPNGRSHARPVLDAMRPSIGIEMRPEIDEMPNEAGLMRPPRTEIRKEREDLPEALRLHFYHAPWCYTVETPSKQNIVARLTAQRAALAEISRMAVEGAFRTS